MYIDIHSAYRNRVQSQIEAIFNLSNESSADKKINKAIRKIFKMPEVTTMTKVILTLLVLSLGLAIWIFTDDFFGL